MSSRARGVPSGVSATGVQRALGERRKRRMAERGGEVDLDATMSSWPTPDPPTRPRPVVRPRRARPGAAEQPTVPTPSALVLRSLADQAPPRAAAEPAGGSRRTRRTADAGPFGGTAAAGATVLPAGSSRGLPSRPAAPASPWSPRAADGAPASREPARDPVTAPDPAPTPTRRGRARTGGEPDAGTGPPGAAAPTGGTAPVPVPGDPAGDNGDGQPRRTRVRQRGRVADAVQARPADTEGRTDPFSPLARTGLRGAPPDAGHDGRHDDGHEGRDDGGDDGRPLARARRGRGPDGGAGRAASLRGLDVPRVRPTPVAPFEAAVPPRAGDDDSRSARAPRGLLGSRRTLLAAVAAVLAAVLVVVAVVLTRRGGDEGPALQPANDALPQRTLLVALLGDDSAIARAAVLAVDDESLVALAVPDELVLTVSDGDTVPLSQSITVDAQAPDRGLEDTLGMRVDGTWILDRASMSTLVGEVGGAEVNVAAEVTEGEVTVPAGADQLLTGPQAVAYAFAEGVDGEGPAGGAERFQQVLLSMLGVMPTDPDEVTQLLSTTERNPATTVTSADLVECVTAASGLIGDGAGIPLTTPLAAGAGAAAVDPAGMEALLGAQLAGSELRVSTVGPLRVAVQNGVGTPGLLTEARDRLVAGGFRFAGGGTAADTDVAESAVLVPEDTPQNRERGEAVAVALGLTRESLAVVPPGQGTGDVDVIVVVGQDFADDAGTEDA